MPGEMPQTAPPKVQQSATSYYAGRGAALAGVLVALRDVRAGLRQRPDGHGADRADRQGFRHVHQALFLGASVLSVALVVDNVMNGAARPFFGWVSDHIGRETTMAIAFTLGGCAYLLLAYFGHSPGPSCICAGLIFFTWGEIFSLFPSTCTDLFGAKFATTNAMLLYTAKGTSAWLVPLANVLKTATGSWQAVFLVAAATNFVVVLLAVFVLGPVRRRRAVRTPRGGLMIVWRKRGGSAAFAALGGGAAALRRLLRHQASARSRRPCATGRTPPGCRARAACAPARRTRRR